MKRADLTELEIEEKEFRLRIRRNPGEASSIILGGTNPPFPMPSGMAEVGPQAPVAAPPPPHPAPAREAEAGVVLVKSPMVGTFYRSPSPESPPYVEEGDSVTESTVIGIIEAMKVMNEIQAEVKGKVLEVLVENGKTVEFGQPLLKVKGS